MALTWTAPWSRQNYYSKVSAVLTVLECCLLGCRLDGTVATAFVYIKSPTE